MFVKYSIKPTDEAAIYPDYERPKWAMEYGIKLANTLDFSIK